MIDRIKQVRKSFKLTQDELGSRIGLKNGAISKIESGKVNLSDGNIKLICYELGIDETWLKTGDGEMFAPTGDDELTYLFGKNEDNIPPLTKQLFKTYFKSPHLQQAIEELVEEAFKSHIEEQKKEDE